MGLGKVVKVRARVLRIWLASGLFLVISASGCLGGDGDSPSPTPTTSPTDGTNTTAAPPAGGAEVYNQTISYTSVTNPAPTAPAMTVAANYSSIAFSIQIRKTGGAGTCAVLVPDPPAAPGQPSTPPRITFRPPSGSAVAIDLGQLNDCNSAMGNLGAPRTGTASSPAQGEWTVTLNGRGQGISLIVMGRAT